VVMAEMLAFPGWQAGCRQLVLQPHGEYCCPVPWFLAAYLMQSLESTILDLLIICRSIVARFHTGVFDALLSKIL
jgi:hypothetical protein